MEFTPSPSSIFQNKKIKYNNKKPTKNRIIWINFSKIRKARRTLTPLSLRSARLTQYMRFARCTSLSHILLRYAPQNIAYTETLTVTFKNINQSNDSQSNDAKFFHCSFNIHAPTNSPATKTSRVHR